MTQPTQEQAKLIMNNTTSTLSLTTKSLHMIIAVGMITLIGVGIYMSENEVYALYDLHKAFGALILLFAIPRVLWRIKKGWPTPATDTSRTQLFVAKTIHWILIISTLLYPISGLMMSIGGGHGFSFFGIEIVTELVDAAGETIPVSETAGNLGHSIHGIITYLVIGSILLHVAGALKHHVLDNDDTLKRMFSFK